MFFDFDLFVVPERTQNTKTLQGKGERGIFIVYEPNEELIELPGFLSKVLQAVKIDMDKDIYLLPLGPGSSFSFSALCGEKEINHIISFGIPAKRLGLHFNYQLYSPHGFNNRTFLFVDPLQAIFEERQAGGKRMSGALWKVLKTLFLS